MRGYLMRHKTILYDGILADAYFNDPYVWFFPYLWSFCHAKQARIEVGMKILWLSKVDGMYCCDLVFVVGEILPLEAARALYTSNDTDLEAYHFRQGLEAHPDMELTFVADMKHSYIPHPAVPLEAEVNTALKRQRSEAKPLGIVWRRPSGPLRVEAIDELEQIVAERAQQRITGKLSKTSQRVTKMKHPKGQLLSRDTQRS